jgi:hypothetical protein
MYAKKAAVIAAMSSLALVSATASARVTCWYPNESTAVQLHTMNIQLMVGSLQCQRVMPALAQNYEAFSESHRQILDAHGRVLKLRFGREEGGERGDGQVAFDRYSTSIANSFATNPIRQDAQSCARLDSLVRVAAQMAPEQLTMLASSLIEAPVSGACPPSNYAFANQAPIPREPAARVVVSEDQVATATMQDGVLTYTPPQRSAEIGGVQPVPARAVQPAAPAAPAGEVGSASTPVPQHVSPSDVLKTAVTALQAATAALQMSISAQNGAAAPAAEVRN